MIRLASGSVTEADRQAFEAWRGQGPAYEVAFERESLAWEHTERLRALRPPLPQEALEVSLRPATELSSSEAELEALVRRRRWSFAALAASVLIAGVALVFWMQGAATEYVTAIGERRVIQLEDGSRLELNTDTRVAVRFTDQARQLELVQGESLFDVFPDASRPFTVTMGDNEVRAVGTAFNIRRDASGYRVLVTEGVVEASGKATASTPAYRVRLPAGTVGTAGDRGMASRLATAEEQERALSWRSGTIVLAGETLAEAVQEFNRYNTRRIVVADPAIAGLQLGGYFNAHDVDGFVKVLASGFAVEVTMEANDILLTAAPRTRPAREAAQ